MGLPWKLPVFVALISVVLYFALPPEAWMVCRLLLMQTPPDDPSQVMKAVCYSEHGDSSVLKIRDDYPRPQPLAHQILVKVHFSSLNPCDYKFRRNPVPDILARLLLPKPKIPGDDIAGIVAAVGSGVPGSQFKVGDRVAAMLDILGSKWGAGAQYVAVDANFAAHVPENVSLDHAAAMPLVSLTALQAFLKLQGPLKNKSILIQAGAGGVGCFAVQWAKRVLGMRVIATCSTGKVSFLQSLGADQVIDYKSQEFDRVLRDVDVVMDPMSYKYEQRTFASPVLKEVGGHYLNILGSDFALGANGWESGNGPDTVVNLVKAKVRRLLNSDAQNYDVVGVQPSGSQLQAILDRMAAGSIRAVVERTFPLEKAAEAYDTLEQGHTTGKILLEMPA